MAPKRLGIPSHLYCVPLIRGLRGDSAFEIVENATAWNAKQLREQTLDAAFLSPIDYAREGSEYSILPGVAVSSRVATETIALHFRDGVRTINTLAVDPSSTSEIILATILLGEEFDVRPRIVPTNGSLDVMLEKADAALLVGDAAVMETATHQNKLDLVEMWIELTDLPYVHGMWCCREGSLDPDHILKIKNTRGEGLSTHAEISEELSTASGQKLSPELITQYLQSFSYDFSEAVQDGMNEFLRYAYYHGILPDVPDLHFYGADKDGDQADSPFSLN